MSTKKTIDKLTPEQEAKIPEYVERFLKIGLCTDPCDRSKAEDAIAASYLNAGHARPKFIWADSPFQGAKKAAQLAKGSEDVTKEEIQDQIGKASYGSFEAYWVAFYVFLAEQLDIEKDPLIDIVHEIVKNCGVYWTFNNHVILTDRPKEIHLNEENKLHNPDGLALAYANGDGIFALNGQRYPSMLEMAISEEAQVND